MSLIMEANVHTVTPLLLIATLCPKWLFVFWLFYMAESRYIMTPSFLWRASSLWDARCATFTERWWHGLRIIWIPQLGGRPFKYILTFTSPLATLAHKNNNNIYFQTWKLRLCGCGNPQSDTYQAVYGIQLTRHFFPVEVTFLCR